MSFGILYGGFAYDIYLLREVSDQKAGSGHFDLTILRYIEEDHI